MTSNNGKLVATDEEKAEVLRKIFVSASTDNLSSQNSRVDGPWMLST